MLEFLGHPRRESKLEVTYCEELEDPVGGGSAVELELVDVVGTLDEVDIAPILLDEDVDETVEDVDVTTSYWYMFNSRDPPQVSVLEPSHAILHSGAAT